MNQSSCFGWSGRLTSLGLAVVALSSTALAEGEGIWKFSGYLDVYYQRDSRKIGANNTLTLRNYDIRQSKLMLANAVLTAERPAGRGFPVGIFLQGSVGDNPTILHGAEPLGPKKIRWLQQAILSYGLAGGSLDAGKFFSWVGYEGHASQDNNLYSRGFLFTVAQPGYHTGVRYLRPLGKVNLGLYAVQGWNEVEDSNSAKGLGASVSVSPLRNANLAVNYYGGTEGRTTPARHNSSSYGGIAQGPGKWDVHLVDGILTYQVTPSLSFAANADYATAKGKSGSTSGTWYGYAGYLTYKINDKFSVAARAESVFDSAGLRTGTSQTLGSLTSTLSYQLSELALLRFEYRKDESNRESFLGEAGASVNNRDTWSLSYVVKF